MYYLKWDFYRDYYWHAIGAINLNKEGISEIIDTITIKSSEIYY